VGIARSGGCTSASFDLIGLLLQVFDQLYPSIARVDRIKTIKRPIQTNRIELATMAQLLAIFVLLLAAIGGMTDIETACGDDPPLKITTKRDSDKVEVMVKEGKAIIALHSPFGISQAVIERSCSDWPSSVMLRLHLKGLENFKTTNGTLTLEAAVSSQDGKVRLWKDGNEGSPLDAKHPYWMDVRMVGKDGKPVKAIPSTGGYFELHLAKALFEGNPKSLTVSWIDFYR